MTSDDKVTYFGETDARGKRVKFGIKAEDRTRHMYVIGKTGMGKSNLLEVMAVQDIQSGEGLCFIDPHGKTAELLLNYIPENRIKDIVYFAPFDVDNPISFNVMEDVGYDKRHLVVSGLMSTFKKIWVDAWSARMEYILGNTLLALLEYPDATLLGVNKMLSDKVYRKKVVDNITDPAVKSFWVDEFAKYTEKFAAEATPAIQNKIGQFTNNPLIRNIIGQPKSSFDIRKMMDERKILIVNLSKGRVGESNANLLGAMFITKIYLAAMSRADASEKMMKALPNFYLYVDEFQSFANESFADILSEARKYKLNLTIAHQYVEQMSEEVRAAVFGNVGTMIVFRVGSIDAEQFEKEFAPKFTADDIVNLGKYQMYLRLMIDGVGSQPFSARGLPPVAVPAISYKEQAIAASQATFGNPREKVEEYIREWMLGGPAEAKADKPAAGDKAVSATPASGSPAALAQVPRAPQQATRPAQDFRKPQENRPPRAPSPIDMRQPVAPVPPKPRPAMPLPPADPADGFQGLASLKSLVQAPAPKPAADNRPKENRHPERKGVTAESRLDLKMALAALIKPEQNSSKPAEPKPAPAKDKPAAVPAATQAKPPAPAPAHKIAPAIDTSRSTVKPQEKPAEKPAEKPVEKAAPQPKKEGLQEVPEDVLKRMLEV
ncbi:MAG TPA: DUF87 domain-containing protein [Candidatus Paceibacterota bacterium]